MYTLPNKKTTEDPKEYVGAWRSLADEVLKVMPNWQLASFDPDLGFYSSLHHNVTQSVSVELAEAIKEQNMKIAELESWTN